MFKRTPQQEPDVPVAPMLDMAFQLLTFFVLTYRPMPIEGQFAMSLLPQQPAARVDATPPDTATVASDLPASVRTVTTTLRADDDGRLAGITLGEVDVRDLDELKEKLGDLFGNPDLPFDQTLIQVDPRLKYDPMMKVVDLFSRHTSKISFAELEEAPGGAAP